MTRRRSSSPVERWHVAAVFGVAAGLTIGGRAGFVVGAVAAALIMWPDLAHRITGRRAPNGRRREAPALAAAALVAALAVFGVTVVGLVVGAAAALWIWRRWWPKAQTVTRRAAGSVKSARVGHRRVQGNHHGRPDVVEEVPSGRVGLGRRKGGTGPTQVELCARASIDTNKLRAVASRRYVNARWRIVGGPTPCQLKDTKKHWTLAASGRGKRG